jgi:integrase
MSQAGENSGEALSASRLSSTVSQYVSDRSRELREKTQAIQQEHIEPFVEFLDTRDVGHWGELGKHHLLEFKAHQREEAELAETTLASRLIVVRTFLKWTQAYYDVPESVIDAADTAIPDLDPEDWVRETFIGTERVEEVLDQFNSTPAWGTRPHITFLLIWHVGMRRGTLRALDVEDINFENQTLSIRHRNPSTPLKNGSHGERDVNISAHVAEVLQSYIETERDAVTVEEEVEGNGMVQRRPLLTTTYGRSDGTTLYRDVTSLTSCGSCGYTRRDAYKCSEAVGPHDLRRSSLTHHVRNDIDRSLISDRANVGEETLERHYDQSTHKEKAALRRDPILDKLDSS